MRNGGRLSAFARAPTSLEQILEWVYSRPETVINYIAARRVSEVEADTVIPIQWGKKKIYMLPGWRVSDSRWCAR